jgi:hypothetical protein
MPERRLHQMNWGAAISPTDALQVMDVGAFLAHASLPIRPDSAGEQCLARHAARFTAYQRYGPLNEPLMATSAARGSSGNSS